MFPLNIADSSATGLWLQMLSYLVSRGERVSPRGLGTVELRPAVMSLTDPRNRWIQVPERKLSKRLGYLEALMLLSGTSDSLLLVKAAPHYANFVNPVTNELDGAYGPRVGPQLDYVRDLLRRDPDTRQAVISIFGPVDHRESRDVPCTVSLHFMVRDGALELVVYMRSNDAWLGWPYDVVMFTVLQEALAIDLGLQLGQYVHVDGSLHLYDTNREQLMLSSIIRPDGLLAVINTKPDRPMPEGMTLEDLQGYARAVLSAYRYNLTVKEAGRHTSVWPAFFVDAAYAVLKKEG